MGWELITTEDLNTGLDVHCPEGALGTVFQEMGFLGLLTVHQVKNEAEFIRRVEGVGHTDNERTVLQGGTEADEQGKAALESTRDTRHHPVDVAGSTC